MNYSILLWRVGARARSILVVMRERREMNSFPLTVMKAFSTERAMISYMVGGWVILSRYVLFLMISVSREAARLRQVRSPSLT